MCSFRVIGAVACLLISIAVGCHRSAQRAPSAAANSTTASGVKQLIAPEPSDAEFAHRVDQAAAEALKDAPPAARGEPAAAAAGGLAATQSSVGKFGGERFRLVNQRDEIVAQLDNGLTVICKRVASPVAAVRAYAMTGGVYEGKWLGGGLSHLLEHLVAGGTNERRTEAQNRDLLQELGNNSNAYTTTDHTCFFVNTTGDKMEKAVDLVSGWMFGAAITPAEYRREYEVVQRELEMGKGEPDTQFAYLTEMNRYRVSPARVPVIGYQEVIQGLSRDDVYNYYKLAYVPNNMVFTVSADLDPEVMLAALRKYCGDKPAGRVFEHNVPDEPPVASPRTAVATFPKLGQAKLEIAFPSIKLNNPDLFAMDLLATVLGSGESSILVEELRDKRKLVSAIMCSDSTPTYADGTFAVDMELDPDKVAEATAAVLEILEQVKKDGVSPERLAAAKTQMRAARVKRLQTSEEVAASMGEDFLTTGDPHFSDRYVETIAKTGNDRIKVVANRFFKRERLLTSCLLPAEFVGAAGLPRAEDLLRGAAPTTRAAVAANPESAVKRAELPDGTILLTKRISTSPLVVMQTYMLGGLTREDAKTNGTGNLAMEMLPRGTRTRSAQQIAEFFDSVGGDLGTSCQTNYWSVEANCLKDDFARTFEVYADVLNNPAFPDAELDGMKQRVLAEIESQDADWTAQAFRFFKQKFFGPMNSPYQFLPIGQAPVVKELKTQQLRDWYDGKIAPAHRVMAIYGDVDPAKAEELARNAVRSTPKSDSTPHVTAERPGPADSTTNSGPAAVDVTRVEIQKTEQALAGVVIGYEAQTTIGDPQNFPIAVGDTMCSGYGYPTGYLFEVLRGRGLVYVVHAVNSPGLNKDLPGTFFAYAGCDPKNVNEVVDLMLENIARLQGTPKDVNAEWFGRSKDLIVVSDAMEHQTPAEQAKTAALDEIYGLGYNYHDRFADSVKAVRLNAVRNVAQSRLRKCVVTVSTPAPQLVSVKSGERRYTSFPEVDLTPKGVGHDAGGAK
jgi:zinc protease